MSKRNTSISTTVSHSEASLVRKRGGAATSRVVKAEPRRTVRETVVNGKLVTAADFRRQADEAMTEPSDAVIQRLLERQRAGTNESRRGRPRMSPSTALSKSLNVRFDRDTYARLEAEAARTKSPLADVVRRQIGLLPPP